MKLKHFALLFLVIAFAGLNLSCCSPDGNAANISFDKSLSRDLGNDGIKVWIHPRIARCLNGDLLVLMRYGTAHGGSNGAAVLRRSTDLGKTWSAQTTLFPSGASVGYGGGSLTVLPSGRIIHLFWTTDADWQAINIKSQYSDDHGVTFSDNVTFTNPAGGPWDCWTLARCIVLNDNSLLAPYGKWNRATTVTETRVMRSTDNGATWTDNSMVVTESEAGGYQHGWGECSIVRLDNNVLRLFMRSDKIGVGETKWTNDNRWIYSSDSADEGVTWSAPVQRFKGCSHPCVYKMSDGRLFSIQRKVFSGNWRGLPVVNISADEGITWLSTTEELLLDTTITSDITNAAKWIEVYSDWVEVSPGKLATVYGYQENLGEGVTSVGVSRFKWVEIDRPYNIGSFR